MVSRVEPRPFRGGKADSLLAFRAGFAPWSVVPCRVLAKGNDE